MSEIWKLPSAEKIYESMTAVADNRVNVISSTTGKVWSSSGNKFYDITYDSGNSAIMSNDNSSYWKGEMGYPAIAFLMAIDVIEYDGDIAKLLANVSWKDINQKHKNNFSLAANEVLNQFDDEDRQAIENEANSILEELQVLQLAKLGKRQKPPTGY